MTNLAELDMYLERLCDALGHMDRRTSLKDYCQGLMLPIARKSVEPLAAHIKPTQVRAKHQSLHHFVAKSAWSDTAVLRSVCDRLNPQSPRASRPNGCGHSILIFPIIPATVRHRQQFGLSGNCRLFGRLTATPKDRPVGS